VTEVIATILGGTQAGTLVLVAWLVYKLIGSTETCADARVAQVTTEQHLEEVNFKLAQVQDALTKELKLNDTQAKELQDVLAIPPNPDLQPGDVHGRITRLLQKLSTPATN